MAFNFHRAAQGIVLANSHRGYSLRYPENTHPAFAGALAAGTHSVEIDIYLTADDRLVVTHDQGISRVSTGSGYVEQMTLDALRQYDFGVKFAPQFSGTPIPLLDDVLDWAVENGVGLVVEAKQRQRRAAFVEKLAQLLLAKPQAVGHVQLLGFDHVLINQVKARIPALALQVVTLERYNNQLAAVQQSNASCVCFEYEFAHIDDLRAYKKAGLGVRLYLHENKQGRTPIEQYDERLGVNSRADIIYWLSEGLIDMLSHDDVDYLKSLIEEAGLRWY